MSNEKLYTKGNLCLVIIFAILIRWLVSLHSYSGKNCPPLYGDYEAQRHWMEITVNLPLEEWYFNTSNNDLLYWGLDYPPLTAYHSYFNGKIAQYLNPQFVKLFTSRGYESINHKLFMRSTVIVADLVIYIVSVITYFICLYSSTHKFDKIKQFEISETDKVNTKTSKNFNTCVSYLAQIAISLLYPGLILIDHGHFQYNSVSLGFTVSAITALVYDKFCLSSFFFCLALNYKQMTLYYSLPFFVYMLSHSFYFNTCYNFFKSFKRLLCISFTVISTFLLFWYPFLSNSRLLFQVILRIFPFSRGIFEDKVSNIWCVVNIFYKLNKIYSQAEMARICIICVTITSLFSLTNLFKYPTIKRLILSLINVSLSFFLFSYQVHEKTILLVSLPIILFFPFDPFPCFWFLVLSNFSMLPLLLKDNLLIPFISLSLLFVSFVFATVNILENSEKKLLKNMKKNFYGKNISYLVNFIFKLSILGCIIIFLFSVFIKPPVKYPDIWPLLMSVYSCFHFLVFLLYFNYLQIFKTVE